MGLAFFFEFMNLIFWKGSQDVIIQLKSIEYTQVDSDGNRW